jgi:DNA-binding protein YbaB
MQQAKQLWDLRNKAMAMQKALAQEFVTVEKNGVKVVMSGDQKVQKIEIEGEENRDVAEAINEAIKESQKVAAKKIQEMGGGLQGLLGGLGQ